MTLWQRVRLLVLITLPCLLLDQATKWIAEAQLKGQPDRSYLDGIFRLKYVENRGIALSFGAELSEEWRFWLFTVGLGALLLGIIAFILFSKQMHRTPFMAYAVVLGGGLGNLADRIFNNGGVIDFMILSAGPLQTGIFNVADMLIMFGCAALFILLWRADRQAAAQAAAEAAAAEGATTASTEEE